MSRPRTLVDIRREQAALRAEARALRPERVRQQRTRPEAAGQRQPRERDADYLSLLHELPCFAGLIGALGPCSGPVEASHVKLAIASRGLRGWGVQERSDDRLALPLCVGHHREGLNALHRIGERRFYDRLGFGDAIADLCRDLHATAPDVAQMRAELARHVRHVRYAREHLHRQAHPLGGSSLSRDEVADA